MKITLPRLFITLSCLFTISLAKAQTAPAITYTPSTNVYTINTTISTLSPANTGGAVSPANYGAVATYKNISGPFGVFVDASNNVYTIDNNNGYLYKYNAAGTGGTINTNTLVAPAGLVVDGLGNIYVSDWVTDFFGNMTYFVYKFSNTGTLTATISGLNQPYGVAVDASNNLYIADSGSGNIIKVAAGTTTKTNYATGFTSLYGIVLDAGGNVYVSQQSQNNIIKVASGTLTKSTFATGFNGPRHLNKDAYGNIYVADYGNNAIKRINNAGTVTSIISTGLSNPRQAAFDTNGNLFEADYTSNTVKVSLATTYSISAALPAGLNFNTTTGQITGTPTAVSAATNYTITAYNTGGSSSTVVNIAVLSNIPAAPTVTNGSNCGATNAVALSASGAPTGGSYKWYTVSSGGTAIAGVTGATYSPVVPVTTTFYVTRVSAGGIESATRTPVTATIYPVVTSPYPNAYLSYSFNTASPSVAANTLDVSGTQNDGVLNSAPTLTTDRYGFTASAYNFNGTSQWISTTKQITNPQVFTISAWINTNTNTGGKIVGFTIQQNGGGNHDRHIYMDNSGHIYFGVYSGATNVIGSSTATFNDSKWHHIVATLSSAGTKLYVDNVLQGSNGGYTAAEAHDGWWCIGGNNIANWPNNPSSSYFKGIIDDVAIYSTDLSSSVASMNDVNQIGAYAPVCTGSPLTIYAPTITGATFTWTDPNNAVVTGQNGVFSAAVAGGYALAVTGGPGGCTSNASFTPTLYALPTAGFTATSAVNINANATITISPASVATGNTYSWSFDGGTPTPTATNTSGPYTVKWTTYGIKNVVLTVTNANGCLATSTQTVTVGPNNTTGNYAFNQSITLNTSGAGISSTLTNFPALVYIKEDALKSAVNCANNVQSPAGGTNGYDFAFTLPGSTTELFYQVDSFDPTTGTLLAWVQIPSVTAANTNLTFYFGSTTPAHTSAFTAATWYSDYQAVYHFNEGSIAATITDATGNGRNAAQSNLALDQDEIRYKLGLTGGAYKFNGTTSSYAAASKIIQSAGTTTSMTGTFTLSAWINTIASATSTEDYKIVTNENNYGYGYKMSVKDANASTMNVETETRSSANSVQIQNAGVVSTTTNTTTSPAWHYVQSVYDGTNFINYVDGAKQATATGYAPDNASTNIYIGLDYRGTTTAPEHVFSGVMDEVRISNLVKSSDWLKLEYYNQSNPVTFTTSNTAIAANATVASAIGGSIMYTWTGASTDPTSAANWTSAASGSPNFAPPYDGFCSLLIKTGKANYPSLTTDESIFGLTLEAGSTFNLNGFNLSVGCNIYNTAGGKISYSNSTASDIIWNGSTASQTYTGSSTSNSAQAGNMTVNNSAGGTVTVSGGAIDVYNLLTITKGNLTIDNTNSGVLNLKSSAGQTAAVDVIPSTYTINGKVNAERFITGTSSVYRGYRLISSPVNVTQTTSAATNYISLSYLNTAANGNYGAFTGGPGAGFSVTNGNPTIYMYNENLKSSNSAFISGKNVGIYSITGNTVKTISSSTGSTVISADLAIPVGNGFIMYFVGSTNGRASGSAATAISSATLTANGYLNQQDVTVNLWYTPGGATGTTTSKLSYGSIDAAPNVYKGYNMVGNPYACAIDLSTFYANNSAAISGNFYELYNQSTGQNQTYVVYSTTGTSSSNASRYISSGQGFFVVASGINKAIIFKEGQKAATTQATAASIMSAPNANQLTRSEIGPSFKSLNNVSAEPADLLTGLHLKVSKDTSVSDECGIYFSKQWSDAFDINDAYDLDGAAPKVYLSSFTADGVRTALNKFADYTAKGKRIRLYVRATTDGMYSMNIPDIQNIDTVNYKINLIDHFKNDSLDIGRYKTYNFNISNADTTTFGANRFELVIEQIANSKYKLLSFTAQKATGGVLLSWKASNEGSNYFYTLEKLGADGADYAPVYQTQSNGAANYNFTDKNPITGNNVYRLKQVDLFGNITYSAPVNIYYDQTGNEGLFTVYPNPTAETLHVNITFGKTNDTADSYKLNIYDATGSLVMQKTSGNTNWSENVGNFKPGIYIVELKSISGNSLGKAKFVKK